MTVTVITNLTKAEFATVRDEHLPLLRGRKRINPNDEPLPVTAYLAASRVQHFFSQVGSDHNPKCTRGGRGRWRWAKLKLHKAQARSTRAGRGAGKTFTRVTFAHP